MTATYLNKPQPYSSFDFPLIFYYNPSHYEYRNVDFNLFDCNNSHSISAFDRLSHTVL
ncbi:MAG: hypothetical protein LBT79_01090 [Elusimicrobiota bacterium]|jgi:hypothetical protein|nr:hypothetical protein [Elusimicrobiota bacterium]